MDDFDFSTDDEEETAEDMEAMVVQDPPSTEPVDLSIQPISQKRNHESYPSDSDQQCSPEWVKVGKKKGKRGQLVDSIHVG